MKKTALAVFFICAGVGGTIRQGCTGKDASHMTSLARGIITEHLFNMGGDRQCKLFVNK